MTGTTRPRHSYAIQRAREAAKESHPWGRPRLWVRPSSYLEIITARPSGTHRWWERLIALPPSSQRNGAASCAANRL